MRIHYFASELGNNVRRNLLMLLSLIVSVGVSLVLAGCAWIAHDQVTFTTEHLYAQMDVRVELCNVSVPDGFPAGMKLPAANPRCPQTATSADKTQLEDVLATLQTKQEVKSYRFISHQKAYSDFRQTQPDLASVTTADALPESYYISLTDSDKYYDDVVAQLRGLDGVDQVDDVKSAFEPILQTMHVIEVAALVVGGIAAVGAGLIIVMTTILSFRQRQREVGIMRLVGASNFSIELPFVLETLLAAALGSAMCWGILVAIKVYLFDRLAPSQKLIPFVPLHQVHVVAALLSVIGVVVCTLASWATVHFTSTRRAVRR